VAISGFGFIIFIVLINFTWISELGLNFVFKRMQNNRFKFLHMSRKKLHSIIILYAITILTFILSIIGISLGRIDPNIGWLILSTIFYTWPAFLVITIRLLLYKWIKIYFYPVFSVITMILLIVVYFYIFLAGLIGSSSFL